MQLYAFRKCCLLLYEVAFILQIFYRRAYCFTYDREFLTNGAVRYEFTGRCNFEDSRWKHLNERMRKRGNANE